MMKFARGLLVVAVVCSIIGSVVVLANDGDDPAFNTFIASLIATFRALAAERRDGIQFAVLVLLTQEQIQQWDATYQPPITFPRPDPTNALIPADPSQYGNYIAARPDFWCKSVAHCESQMMAHLDDLYNTFTAGGNTVAAIVLYTHFVPCGRCTRAIRDNLERPQFNNINRIVVFERSEGARFLNLNYTQCVFDESNIGLHRFCGGLSSSKRDAMDECAVILSFQSFLIDCLGDTTAARFTSAREAASDLVNRVMDQCRNQLSNLETCSWDALDDLIGPAQGLQKKNTFMNEYRRCVQQANEHQRLDLLFVAKPNSLGMPISSLRDLQDYTPKTYTCKDKRMTGVLCSYYDSNYLTAGNTVCRENSPCGKHGYSYYWCYTDYSNSWEYCCSGSCGYHGYSYIPVVLCWISVGVLRGVFQE